LNTETGVATYESEVYTKTCLNEELPVIAKTGGG
jgi:hypothetical protein